MRNIAEKSAIEKHIKECQSHQIQFDSASLVCSDIFIKNLWKDCSFRKVNPLNRDTAMNINLIWTEFMLS